MKVGYIRALTVLHHTFKSYPMGDRVHILGRFLSCPFLRVLKVIPSRARILDIGAGHGTFARLAVEAGAERVVAVEPDLRKTLNAYDLPRVDFVAAFDDAITGEFDAITMFDVLYRIPRTQWEALFRRILERLSEGGAFYLKELDPGHKLKFAWNRLQETISDRFLKLTLGDAFVYASREETIAAMKNAGFREVETIAIDFGYPHSHVLYIGRK